jgi:hypothetical protein
MKDPAFLFYPEAFITGTLLMTDEQVGKYIRLLCLQHQQGHMPEEDMINICKSYDKRIFSKFTLDEDGLYFNERLQKEIDKRKAYAESRGNNKRGKKKSYENHMKIICESQENHTINTNTNKDISLDKELKTVSGTKKTVKHKYAEFVQMTEEEHNKLLDELGDYGAQSCINILNNYKGANGKKYKSDYLAIRNWVIDRYNQNKPQGMEDRFKGMER